MKIGIIGLSNSGKTTVFNALTGQNLETTIYPTTPVEPAIGVVKVPDARLDKLSEIFKPKKTTHAAVEYIDYIGLTKGDAQQNRKVFDLIKDVDFTNVLKHAGVRISMDGKGRWIDNVFVERLWRSLKSRGNLSESLRDSGGGSPRHRGLLRPLQ